VDEACAALRRAGHEVVSLDPSSSSSFYEASLLYLSLMAAEGKMQGFIDGLEGEALHPMYSFLYRIACLPGWLRPPLGWVMRKVLRQPRMADLILAGRQRDVHGLWACTARRDAIRAQLISNWQSQGLDALVCPGLGVPAFPHGRSDKLNQACSYTFLWNNFHFPAGTVPVTTVKQEEDGVYESSFEDTLSANARASMVGSVGLPVGVQIVALPWMDEQCVRAMAELEAAMSHTDKVKATTPPGLFDTV
jgi:fatty acid amide hydrolase